jgi:hypothetical protein
LPDWVPPDAWQAWVRYRGRKFSAAAQALSLRTLARLRTAGHDPTAVIEQSIERGWTGLFELKDAARGNARGLVHQPSRTSAAVAAWADGQPHHVDDERTIDA